MLYTSEIIINAGADKVYEAITDIEKYNEWNPWIIKAKGECEEGSVIEVKAKLGSRVLTVQHKILEMVPGKVFKWADMGWFTKVAYGERVRTIEPLPEGGVRYKNELPVTGMLAWLAHLSTGNAIQEGMQAENAALKKLLENS